MGKRVVKKTKRVVKKTERVVKKTKRVVKQAKPVAKKAKSAVKKPPRAKPITDAGIRFYVPASLADLEAARTWLADAQLEANDGWGAGDAWTVRELPSPRLHPRAPALLAAAANASPEAIAAVLTQSAFIDTDGELRVWPWYPEEDAVARPVAIARAKALGLGLPREHLDEPYEPAHYLRRATSDALLTWLAGRGVDAATARIDRIPIPSRRHYKPERFEGGMTASSAEAQAIGTALRTIRLFEYVGDNQEQRGELEAKLDRELAFACDRIAKLEARVADTAHEPEIIELPFAEAEVRPVGRVSEVHGLRRGALLVTDGALIVIDRRGGLVGAWRRPMGDLFAIGDMVLVNYSHALDVAAGRFIEGELREILNRMGLETSPSTGGHDERTTPVISGCGRYLLDVDEQPYIVRLVDGTTVAEGSALEKAVEVPAKPGKGLVDPSKIAVGRVTVLDGVRFTVRGGEAPVRDGRSLAFTLAGDHWRILTGDAIREGSRTIARLGVPVHAGAFRADGAELWALGSDHLFRIDLAATPKLAASVLIEPILQAAARALEASS